MTLFCSLISIFFLQSLVCASSNGIELRLEAEAMKMTVNHSIHVLHEESESRQSLAVVEAVQSAVRYLYPFKVKVVCCGDGTPTFHTRDFVNDLSQLIFYKWAKVANFTPEQILDLLCKRGHVETDQGGKTQMVVSWPFSKHPDYSSCMRSDNTPFIGVGQVHFIFLASQCSFVPLSLILHVPNDWGAGFKQASSRLPRLTQFFGESTPPNLLVMRECDQVSGGEVCHPWWLQPTIQPNRPLKKIFKIIPKRFDHQKVGGQEKPVSPQWPNVLNFQNCLYDVPLTVLLTWLFSLFHNILVVDLPRTRRYMLRGV